MSRAASRNPIASRQRRAKSDRKIQAVAVFSCCRKSLHDELSVERIADDRSPTSGNTAPRRAATWPMGKCYWGQHGGIPLVSACSKQLLGRVPKCERGDSNGVQPKNYVCNKSADASGATNRASGQKEESDGRQGADGGAPAVRSPAKGRDSDGRDFRMLSDCGGESHRCYFGTDEVADDMEGATDAK